MPGTWKGRARTELRLCGDDGRVSLGFEVFSLRSVGPGAARWHSFAALSAAAVRTTAFVIRFATPCTRAFRPGVTLDDALPVPAVIEATYRYAAEREMRVAGLLENANVKAVAG